MVNISQTLQYLITWIIYQLEFEPKIYQRCDGEYV